MVRLWRASVSSSAGPLWAAHDGAAPPRLRRAHPPPPVLLAPPAAVCARGRSRARHTMVACQLHHIYKGRSHAAPPSPPSIPLPHRRLRRRLHRARAAGLRRGGAARRLPVRPLPPARRRRAPEPAAGRGAGLAACARFQYPVVAPRDLRRARQRGSTVEQVICNHWVAGSIPVAGSMDDTGPALSRNRARSPLKAGNRTRLRARSERMREHPPRSARGGRTAAEAEGARHRPRADSCRWLHGRHGPGSLAEPGPSPLNAGNRTRLRSATPRACRPRRAAAAAWPGSRATGGCRGSSSPAGPPPPPPRRHRSGESRPPASAPRCASRPCP